MLEVLREKREIFFFIFYQNTTPCVLNFPCGNFWWWFSIGSTCMVLFWIHFFQKFMDRANYFIVKMKKLTIEKTLSHHLVIFICFFARLKTWIVIVGVDVFMGFCCFNRVFLENQVYLSVMQNQDKSIIEKKLITKVNQIFKQGLRINIKAINSKA